MEKLQYYVFITKRGWYAKPFTSEWCAYEEADNNKAVVAYGKDEEVHLRPDAEDGVWKND